MVKGILVKTKPKDVDPSFKMDHADLIAEMNTVENLPTHERLQLARLRRSQQLKIARQKEKEWMKLQKSQKHQNQHQLGHSKVTRHITFENSVVLLEAASRNDIQEVANLLQRGITADAANEDGLTALHQCCIDNNLEMLKLLLDYGANVDAQDSDKWTPLHAAATCGHLDLVRILISRGANLLSVNTDGNMPYDLCDDENTLDFIEAEMSKRGVTQELIDETRALTEKQMLSELMKVASNGGDLEEPDHQGATPLHIAAANGYSRVVEFLLEMHVNVDAMDKDLWSPVHAAACWGHLEVLEMLAQHGADLNSRNKDDETPSDICEDPEIRERIDQLRSEQESKRLAEAQRRRVRRSQSNNTRAQSVRRTSLRDKTLTTKKDAVEETRLRLQAQEVFITPDSTSGGGVEQVKNADSKIKPPQSLAGVGQVPNNNFNSTCSVIGDPVNDYVSNQSRRGSSSVTSQVTETDITSTSGGYHHLNHHHNPQTIVNNNPNGNINNGSIKNSCSNISTTTSQSSTNICNNNHNNSAIHNNNNNNSSHTNMINGGGVGGNNKNGYPTSSPKDLRGGSSYYSLANMSYDNVDSISSGNSRRPPEGKDNEGYSIRSEKHSGGMIGSNSTGSLHTLSAPERSTEIFQTTKENGKINVQVTVLVDTHNLDNTMAGATLANLKKQRSQSRTNALTENGTTVIGGGTQPSTPTAVHTSHFNNLTTPTTLLSHNTSLIGFGSAGGDGGGHGLGPISAINSGISNSLDYNLPTSIEMNSHLSSFGGNGTAGIMSCSSGGSGNVIIGGGLTEPNDSSIATITKFSGVTGDVVSDGTRSNKCCLLM